MVLPGLALAVLLGLMLDRGVEALDVGALEKRDGHYFIYYKGKRRPGIRVQLTVTFQCTT
jgi:hypothetical protein